MAVSVFCDKNVKQKGASVKKKRGVVLHCEALRRLLGDKRKLQKKKNAVKEVKAARKGRGV